jgi:hypothetical protein
MKLKCRKHLIWLHHKHTGSFEKNVFGLGILLLYEPENIAVVASQKLLGESKF